MSAQIIVACALGVAFIVTLLVLAIKFPHPTPFQYNVFRIVLSLAAAGEAAVVPGFLNVSINTSIRAGGALAVFIVVFFFNPAKLVATTGAPPIPDGDVTFSVPQGWSFRQVIDKLVEGDNALAEYHGFSSSELSAALKPYELRTKTLIEAIRTVRTLAETPVRDYTVSFDEPTYHLNVRG